MHIFAFDIKTSALKLNHKCFLINVFRQASTNILVHIVNASNYIIDMAAKPISQFFGERQARVFHIRIGLFSKDKPMAGILQNRGSISFA